ncbi:MAG: protein TolQ [Pseudobdellovibrionaceae bacterium]
MNTANTVNISAFDSIMHASLVVQLTLILLILLSIACWTVAFSKWKSFRSIRTANEKFITKFWKVSSLDSLYEDIDEYTGSPLAEMFKTAYVEMKKIADAPSLKQENSNSLLGHVDNLERVLRRTMETEMADMESRLSLMATTGSTGPFIGLFGTVWGIMSSFQKIGATGSASLAVVAPGISEALVATAIGLAVAIPAVSLYNHFVSQIKKQEIEMSNFATDFLNIVKRNFFKT